MDENKAEESSRYAEYAQTFDGPSRVTALLIPVGETPLEVRIDPGDALHELQGYVGGYIEPLGVLGGGVTLYVNDEGLGTLPPNRALYATGEMEREGYLSQIDFSHVSKEGELYTILFGNIVAVSYNEEGELQDLPKDQLDALKRQFADPFSGILESARLAREHGTPLADDRDCASLPAEARDMRDASDGLNGFEAGQPRDNPER